MGELQHFQKLVIKNAAHAKGLQVGQKAIDFALPNAIGNSISLAQNLKKGPVVLKFYRGEWCPICNLDLRKLQQVLPKIRVKGASLLAISPQSPDNALTIKEKNNLGFEVLSDTDYQVIKNYDLQFDPGEDYHRRRDLSMLNANGSLLLPIPATFIIDQDFTVKAAHVEANYTERMEPETIIKILDHIKNR